MTGTDMQKAALVMFAARQVGPAGSLEEMRAIAYCIRNRVKAGWHDGNFLAVIEHAAETAGNEPIEPFIIDTNRSAFQRMLRDIDEIFYGERDEETDGLFNLGIANGKQLYWCYVNLPIREWFKEKIIQDHENHRESASMGLMMFYE